MTTEEYKALNSPHSQSKRIHALFEQQLQAEKIGYVTEYKFHEKRKWRFDFALIFPYTNYVAIELEGGYFVRGGHSRGAAQIRDNEKFNEAALLGWKILRFTPQQITKGEAIRFIKRLFE